MSDRYRDAAIRPIAWSRRRFLETAAATSFGLAASSVIRPGRARAAQELTGSIRIGYEGSNTQIAPFIEETVAELEAAHPGANFTIEPSPGSDYILQLGLQLFTGRGPDLFLVLGLGAGELANGNLILPLDDYVANWDGWDHYSEAAKASVTHEGSIWGIPYGVDISFLFYRRDLFAQAGLPTEWQPQTPDDVLAAALHVKEAVPEAIPYALYAGANGENATAGDFLTLITAYGGTLTDAEGRWFVNSCPIQETLGYYHQAYQVDQSVPQSVMTDVSPLETLPRAFGEGTLALIYEQGWRYQEWLADDPDGAGEQIGYALFPRADGGTPFALAGGGDCWFINRRCQHPDLAWAFIEAFNTIDRQVAINLDEPRLPARIDAAADPAFQEEPIFQTMLDAQDKLVVPPPEPTYRQLIGIVQNATGLVATGETDPAGAVERYTDELVRVLGEEHVVAESCP